MSVRVPLERLGGASIGTDLQLMNDGSCQGVISEDGMAIVITTNLTACNNERREDATFEYYSNTVVEREYGVVTRVSDVYIPFTCTYNRTGRVGLRSYELKNYRLNVTEESSGQYAFALDIYRDEGFEEKYLEEDYPVDMDLNDDLYFGASVPSQEGTLDLSITRCVATPSSSFNDDQFLFIDDGCSVDEGTVIQPDELDFVGVTMKTFRFVGLGNRVSI
nr:ZP domain-containing protein-like [Lytechinus pictus]